MTHHTSGGDCDRTCHGCGREWCAVYDISPGEPDLCAACWDTQDDGGEAA